MKFKMILILLLIQVVIVTKTKAQFFGISGATVSGTPAPIAYSTLDINGTFGINMFKDTSSTSTAMAAAAMAQTSVVLYSNLMGEGRTSLQVPAPGSTYLSRVYIIANISPSTGGKPWALQNGVSYYDLFNVQTFAVPLNTSVMIICDGTNWLQIN